MSTTAASTSLASPGPSAAPAAAGAQPGSAPPTPGPSANPGGASDGKPTAQQRADFKALRAKLLNDPKPPSMPADKAALSSQDFEQYQRANDSYTKYRDFIGDIDGLMEQGYEYELPEGGGKQRLTFSSEEDFSPLVKHLQQFAQRGFLTRDQLAKLAYHERMVQAAFEHGRKLGGAAAPSPLAKIPAGATSVPESDPTKVQADPASSSTDGEPSYEDLFKMKFPDDYNAAMAKARR